MGSTSPVKFLLFIEEWLKEDAGQALLTLWRLQSTMPLPGL